MQTAAFMERRKSRRLDGAPGANGPLPALHLRGDLECVTLRCSSGRLCPWHARSVPEPLTGTAVLLLQTHRLESPSKEAPVWDGASPCPSCVLAGAGSPEGLGKVAGAARGGSGQPSVQSSFALGRWQAWPCKMLSALWTGDGDWQRAVPGASPPSGLKTG